jgi:hypothetical protein
VAATWKGPETDFTPGSTDYSFTGPLKLKGIWTINQGTGRGNFRASAQLTTSAGTPGYKGMLI